MSNVVKLKRLGKPRTQVQKARLLGIEASKDLIEEHGDKLIGRLYDQIRLTEEEASGDKMPQEHIDCMTVSVITQLLVLVASGRNTVGPASLLELVQGEIDEWTDENSA